jgi:hypothetical protein
MTTLLHSTIYQQSQSDIAVCVVKRETIPLLGGADRRQLRARDEVRRPCSLA